MHRSIGSSVARLSLAALFLLGSCQSRSPSTEGAVDGGLDASITRRAQALVTSADADGDGVPNSSDNCPRIANPDQQRERAVGPGYACALSLELDNGLPGKFAKFQSHKEMVRQTSPFLLTGVPDLMRVLATAPQNATAYQWGENQRLGVFSPGETGNGKAETIDSGEVLSISVGSDAVLGGMKATDVWLQLDGKASVSVTFYAGASTVGSGSLSTQGIQTHHASAGGALFDRIELRASSGRYSLRGKKEAAVMFALAAPDLCPTDAAKARPGICGCGRADTDTDGDGVMDCDALTKFDDEPGVDSCLLTIGARPQLDTSMAAASFMSKTKTFAEYLALSRDRSDKLDLIFADLALCNGIKVGDGDGDLVPDSTDQCPNTPPLTPTDEVGCTDPFLPDAPDDDAVREGVKAIQIASASPGSCDTTRSNLTPEVVSGFINNSQLQPAAATVFLYFIPRGCAVRLRVEALTTDPAGWPYGGGKTLYFETGADDLAGAVSGGFIVAGVKSLTLTNPNFGVAYQNVWSEMKDSSGNTASGPSPYHISVRAMAVYADGAQSPWSNLVEVRTIGDR